MRFSFVIPAYNVQDYIERCLDSICRQAFRDFEVIVIDDGSTDKTGELVQAYAARDRRIRYERQANAGQGAARSFGLTLALGDYIWFVDSDDWILESVLSRISNILWQETPDVLVANFEFVYDGGATSPSNLVPPHLAGQMIRPDENVWNFAAVSCWNTPPWRLIARRELLVNKDIRFAKGVFYEDHPFAIQLMLSASKVYIDPSISYAYYQRSTSTTKVNDRKAFDFLEIRKQCLALFQRFEKSETLAQVVVGYLAPYNFFVAHVADEFKPEFLKRLGETLTEQEMAFIGKHADQTTKLFARAAKANDLQLISRVERLSRLKNKYSLGGIKRFGQRIKGGVRRRLVAGFASVKRLAIPQHAGVDTSGQRFLKAGTGTRIESIYIDVRIKQEDRPYVVVGDGSHVGGVFVFERGIGTISIGNKSSIGGGCKLICAQDQGITIGNNVMLSWDCTLIDSNSHSADPEIRANDAYDWKCGLDAGRMGAYKDWSQVRSDPIRIEDGVWVGFDSAIMKGVTLGKGCVIGSKSVVTRSVPAYCIVAGNPAKFVGFVPRSNWVWEEIVDAMQADPSRQQMLKEAYMHSDLLASLDRYRSSGEYLETMTELKNACPSAKTILDIGGAGGTMAVALAMSGYDVTVVEPSVSAVVGTQAIARLKGLVEARLGTPLAGRIHVFQGMLEDFPVSEKFDVVYCRQVVHHFADPVLALTKIRSLTKDTGIVMLLREHVVFDDEDLATFLKHHPFQSFTGGENAYRPEQYRKFIESSGLKLIREYAFTDTLINLDPHSPDEARRLGEKAFAGRPYSYLAAPMIAGQSGAAP